MSFPHDPGPDLAPALLRDPFGTLAGKAAELGADAFESRLAGHTVLCLHGAEAAAFFYDDDRFTRVGAMPTGVVRLLQGEDSVQSLDGEAHRRLEIYRDVVRTELMRLRATAPCRPVERAACDPALGSEASARPG